MNPAVVDEINATFEACGAFFRDAALPDAVSDRYHVGVMLREPTFCDASYRPGGFIAPHRYLIFSSSARSLEAFDTQGWGLCIWARDRRLKVIDRRTDGERTQTTLLEIPSHLLGWFASSEPNAIEQAYADHGRELFEQHSRAAPVPELDTDAWRDRLTLPVGIDDQGRPFSLFLDTEHEADETRPQIVRVLSYLAGVYTQAGDYGEAVQLLRSAATTQRAYAEKDPESPAWLLVALADVRSQLGDTRGAEADLQDAFALFQHLENDRLPVARVLLRLGHVYHKVGEPAAAERNYLHALKIVRRVDGEQTMLAATILSSLGALYEAWGRYDEAVARINEAMDIERLVSGTEQR